MTEPTSHREILRPSETCDWCSEPAVDTSYEVQPVRVSGKKIIAHAIHASVCKDHKQRFDDEKRKDRERRKKAKKRAAWDRGHDTVA